VEPERIILSGIPVRRRFISQISKQEARKKLNLQTDKFTILVMGGGFGVGPIKETVSGLQKLDFDCQVIVICGHNRRLLDELKALKPQFKKPTYLLGFCINVDEVMAASDIMISKIGGMALSEALVKILPILAINPIPGQEGRNASFLSGHNISLQAKGVGEINRMIKDLFDHPQKIEHIRNIMQGLAKPDAAADAARLAIKMIEEKNE
jgi:processive 1,2-diacylglycerol beta-glucosyltransferase